ncbi:MAG: FAD-dependent oxidoreductase [Archaeoglobus sp.]|nr:FAD-dependent oxidoreductase [Archaeoglobus sp.]
MLFEPIEIEGMRIKNRIVMPAVGTNFWGIDGAVTDKLLHFYEERAKNGVGYVVVGVAKIEPQFFGGLAIHDDSYIPGLRKLSELFHTYDVRCAVQLWHPGRYEISLMESEPVSASDIPPPIFTKRKPKALSVEEIHRIQDEFVEAAERAKKAGFDAVELICSAGYLISQFFSPATNKRKDEYGGSIENRARFATEIVERIREEVKIPVGCRISGEEFIEGGNSLEDMKQIAQLLENAGAAYFNVTAGWHESKKPLITMFVPRAAFVYLAEGIKSVVSVPVIASNRINTPEIAEKILQEGKADMVSMMRALLADPELPKKAMEGRSDEIRVCVACNQGCMDYAFQGMPITCLVNPAVGREAEFRGLKAEKKKKIVVVGGGPAGCKAAEMLAEKGHEVILFEKDNRLGGQLLLASRAPYASEFESIPAYFEKVLPRRGVEIRLNSEARAEDILKLKPDVVILALGASPLIPEIAGVEKAVTAFDVLAEKTGKDGEKVVVIGGGGVGCSTAAKLAVEGKDVTIVEMLKRIGSDIGISTRWNVLLFLREKGVKMLTETKAVEISDGGVVVEADGERKLIECDTAVIAVGTKPNDGLVEELKGKVKEVYTIGDCSKPAKALEAIRDAAELALKI